MLRVDGRTLLTGGAASAAAYECVKCVKANKKLCAVSFTDDGEHVMFANKYGDVQVLPTAPAAAEAAAAAAGAAAEDKGKDADGDAVTAGTCPLPHSRLFHHRVPGTQSRLSTHSLVHSPPLDCKRRSTEVYAWFIRSSSNHIRVFRQSSNHVRVFRQCRPITFVYSLDCKRRSTEVYTYVHVVHTVSSHRQCRRGRGAA